MKKYYLVNVDVQEPWNEWDDLFLCMDENEAKKMIDYLNDEDDDFDMDTALYDIAWNLAKALYPEHLYLKKECADDYSNENTPLEEALISAKDGYNDEEIDELLDALKNETWDHNCSEILAELAAELGIVYGVDFCDEDGDEEAPNGDLVIEL